MGKGILENVLVLRKLLLGMFFKFSQMYKGEKTPKVDSY